VTAAAPLLALALAAGAAAPPAAPLDVRVRLERREVRLGEPFELSVEVRHRASERYAWDGPAIDAPFRLLASACARTERAEEAVTACTLRLALFDLGAHDLPALGLSAETPDGPRALAVPGPSVSGSGLIDPAAPAEALGLRDLAAPAPLWVPDLRLPAVAAALAAAALLGGLALRAVRRRRDRAREPAPPLPPHERFARQLDALEQARLGERGRGAEAVARLSEHLREYVGALSGHPALDLTTAELLARLAFQPDPRLDLAGLRAQLEGADLVKFARAPAGPAEAAAALGFARDLLGRTRPAPAAPAPGGEARA
jgi:hypothetical protein